MAGKVKSKRQRASLPIPDVVPASNGSYDAKLRVVESVSASAFQQWWHRILASLRRRHDKAVRPRTVKAGEHEISETAQTVFALYQARGCTRMLPRGERIGARLPQRMRAGMQRIARRIVRSAKRAASRRRHSSSLNSRS